MPDCQSGAVHSLGCGTIIGIAVAGDFGFCHADCHEGKCRKALYELGCSSGRSARLFRGKETGKWLAQEMAKRISCCRAARKEYELPQRALWRSRHPSHRCDRASRRTLIALGENHNDVA